MRWLQDFVDNFNLGYETTSRIMNGLSSHSHHRIEGFCRELGWSANERDGDMIKLHFKDDVVGTRKVVVSGGDDDLVTFAVVSMAVLEKDRVPDEIAPYLLLRNGQLALGTWYAVIHDRGMVAFVLRYAALGAGLNAEVMRIICGKMVPEVTEFDRKMQRTGLLRG